ncbi:MAG: GIY-YIG nuclease family protein [Candidatus Pacebacteria bacterium]|nr:GIY-YIG nuclease family protein [Candidatus Paceibacterota bacterium]
MNRQGLSYISTESTINLSCIYKISSPTNKIYIGKTISLQKRINQYNCTFNTKQGKRNTQPLLFNSFRKYGIVNHTIEVVEICIKELLKDREIYYIELFNTFNKKNSLGLNLTMGGEGFLGGVVSDETKQKLREKATGRLHSKETKQKLSKLRKGIPHTEEWKKKARNYKPTREVILRRLSGMKEPPKVTREMLEKAALVCRKEIVVYKDNYFVGEFKSVRDAAIYLNVTDTNLCRHLKGEYKICRKHIAYYKSQLYPMLPKQITNN